MREILLSQGKVALVDDCDFEELNQFKWYANKCYRGHTWYVLRSYKTAEGKKCVASMHRHILGLTKGDKKIGDHINHNGLDNRRENLRICTHAQNIHNQQKQTRAKSSRFKGVQLRPKSNPWFARIKVDGTFHTIGYFSSEEEAARAYDAAAIQHFGEFAFLNFPENSH